MSKEKSNKKKEDVVINSGKVLETLPNLSFRVELDTGENIIVYLSGRMRRHHIRVLVGDTVKVERSLYDPQRGRVVYREG